MSRFQPRVKRTRRGRFLLRLPTEEREVLRGLPSQLRDLLGSDDPALERLFPPGYPDEPELESEYRNLVRDELVTRRRSALDVMESTIDAADVDEEQLSAWLSALNDLRLVLGTRLEVSEETRGDDLSAQDPQAPALSLYFYLGWLEEQVVEALAGGVDPAGTESR